MDRVDVVKGVSGQRVYFNAPQGRPTSTPSVEIKDKYGNTITASATTNVTQNTVNTTVATQNSIGDTSIVVADSAGIEYKKSYLITNSLGQTEKVRVRGNDGTTETVYFDERLEFVHDTSATFQSCEFYYSLQTAEVDTLEELYRARASYTVGGLNYILEVPFDVVLTPLDNRLTVEFLKKNRPDIMANQPSETLGDDFSDLREVAWDKVRKGIRNESAGWRPALVRTPDDLEEWALAEFDCLAQHNGIKVLRGDWDSQQAQEYLDGKRSSAKTTALSSLEFIDLDEDDALSEDEERPVTLDFIR